MANSVTRDLIIAEAKRRGYAVETVGHNAYFCKITTTEGRVEMFQGSRPTKTTAHAYVIALDKLLSLEFTQSLGYAVPDYTLHSDFDAAVQFLHNHKTIVVKPNDGFQSNGVTVGVDSPDKLRNAIKTAQDNSVSGKVLLQKQVYGKLYRILVINNKFIAAAHRKAAEVTGDGTHSMLELIQMLNKDPRRNTIANDSAVLKKIDIDQAEEELGKEVLHTILPHGEKVKITDIDSVSMGGEAEDVSDVVHDSWKQAATMLSRESGLFINGLDIICPEISEPMNGAYLPLLEMNHMPGLKLHHYPTGGGKAKDVAAVLLDEVFA